MQRLMVFGDSIMKGVVWSEERGRHTMLPGAERTLNTTLRSSGVEIENYAKFGADAETTLRVVTRHLDGLRAEDTVLLGFGGNDCAYNWDAVSADPEGAHAPNTPPEKLEELFTSCIAKVKQAGCRVLAANLVPIDAEKYFSWITRGRDRDAILRWLGDVSMLYRWHESYCELVSTVCRREGVEPVDLRRPFLLRHDYKALICADGMHPTPMGYALLDSVIAGRVLE